MSDPTPSIAARLLTAKGRERVKQTFLDAGFSEESAAELVKDLHESVVDANDVEAALLLDCFGLASEELAQ